ncbi:hypothetical protein [Aliarcobacter cibarius]|uniref:Uncharacterized protein n=1 Tax=Aliarcobacter cibarius TaxID=255507 RepID=A0ABY2V572_9BACT|nr:hypothetical protein [Aliarcobacter cibarius]TLS99272.1 hypothetical protein FE247_06055 [Aliarcobacter cibarius]TLT00415.1 hypothetical protein FE245_05205 [Aliarcobacter cibarius]
MANRGKQETITINCSENDLIDSMKKLPENINFSSLPKIIGNDRKVVISLNGYNKEEIDKYFQIFTDFCINNNKEYVLKDINEIS